MSGRRNRGGGGDGHGGGGEERWLLPYADMITLLLGLFIVLFAMSSLDAKKFDSLRSSLAQTFQGGSLLQEPGNILPSSSGVAEPVATSDAPSSDTIRRAQDIQKSQAASRARYEREAKDIRKVAKQIGLTRAKVEPSERGITISLAGDALFESGSYALKPEVQAKLAKLEARLEQFDREIEISGHTDGQPVNGDPYGNWELSGQRALAVLRFFASKGYDQSKMRFLGYGSQRPKVTPPDDNPQKDIAANRRIEILVLAPGANVPGTAEEKALAVARGPVLADVLDSAVASPPASSLAADADIATELGTIARDIQ